MGAKRISYEILVGKLKDKRKVERSSCKWVGVNDDDEGDGS
jgi:hypothetical protein